MKYPEQERQQKQLGDAGLGQPPLAMPGPPCPQSRRTQSQDRALPAAFEGALVLRGQARRRWRGTRRPHSRQQFLLQSILICIKNLLLLAEWR